MTELIAPFTRIATRYVAGALVTYGWVDAHTLTWLEPEIAMLIGGALVAVVEGAYAVAKRKGWAT